MARPGTARARALLREVSRDTGISVKAIVSPARYDFLSMARREFCVRGVAEGLLVMTLAETIKRDCKTVAYHAFPEYRDRKRVQMRKWLAENRCRAS